ncbi:MAG TPA: hypothetical protein VL285_08165 [Bryobacteraceae bacterium]|nr:hypothetical protein [Bryobacteraceae bacterium]
MFRTFTRLACLLSAAGLIAGPAPAFQAASPKSADAFLHGAPLTLDQMLRIVREKAIPLRRQKEAVQNRGVDFSISAENIQSLESAGAPQDLLDLIIRRAKPAPSAPVSTSSDHVVPAANVGRIVPADGPPVTPALPRDARGGDLFSQMLQALGGARAIPESLSIQAEGSMTVWSASGAAKRWNLLFRAKPGRALFQLRGGGAFQEVAFEGSRFQTGKAVDGGELTAACALILEHQIANLAARLNTPKFRIVARPGAGGGTLTAESSAETVLVTLDPDLRPATVKFTGPTGLGAAVVTYADYIEVRNIFYPLSARIKPDASPQGVEVRFDKIELNPRLGESDYNLSGRR